MLDSAIWYNFAVKSFTSIRDDEKIFVMEKIRFDGVFFMFLLVFCSAAVNRGE